MNEVSHTSTLSAEEVLSQVITPEKKQELTNRLLKLKSTLNEIESRMTEEKVEQNTVKNSTQETDQDLVRKLAVLERISSETRSNINSIAQIQLSEKYHPALNLMIQNLEKVNQAYSAILNSFTK